MKKYSFSGLIIALVILFAACEKLKDPAGLRNVGVVPLISDVSGIFVNGNNSSSISFSVDLSTGESIDNASVEVSHLDHFERVKIADINSFPSRISITLGDVISKLGIAASAISDGDLIYVEVVTTKNGVTTRSNAALNLTVLCQFSPVLAIGSYHSVSGPNEWNSEGNITITGKSGDPYTVYVSGLEAIEGLNEDKGPLVMHINPASFAVIADKTVIASSGFGDHNIAYEGNGTYNSCDGSYTMYFTISGDSGTYGTYLFTLSRNPQ
jgi:hypothetical protein